MLGLYTKIYVVLTLSYLWYRFILLFFSELSAKHETGRYDGQKMTVIIPFYNENPGILRKAIQSIIAADGNKDIVVVDDGSPDKSSYEMVRSEFPDATLVRYFPNQGKRMAQKAGFAHAKGEFIVTIDSDTIIDKDALIKLVEPMIGDHGLAATTGNVKVLNEDENFLTRMISARYWNAFNIERKSLNAHGIVTCCSGVLSAYRRKIMDSCMHRYTSQRFLGEECTFGDDRHLTNLILMQGHKVKYIEDSVCYTEVPTTVRRLFVQQLRWKKSFIRESFIALSYSMRRSFVLTVEVLLNLIIPFWSIALRLALIAYLIIDPLLIPVFVMTVVTVAFIRNFFLFMENRKLSLYSIPYAFLHEFGLFWLYPVALLTIKDKGWGTR